MGKKSNNCEIYMTVEEKERFFIEWKNTCEIVKRGLDKCKNQKLKD